VEFWKGITKYAGLAAMAGMAIFGALHYFVAGPNEVSADEEEKAKNLAGGRT